MNFKIIEKKWQKKWASLHTLPLNHNKQKHGKLKGKYYVLEMFPYPSGQLHVGHIRNYTFGDIVARYKRSEGFDVLHPMGWDAFGLPAENAAIEHQKQPQEWTKDNIQKMKSIFKRMGFSYNWDHEILTCDPNYYAEEQKIFLVFYRKGLLYQKEGDVNWDTVDQCVLANEQVIDGKGWRSGAPVQRVKRRQWYLKITNYTEELIENLKYLTDWPDKVKRMQQNWIGKAEGTKNNLCFFKRASNN